MKYIILGKAVKSGTIDDDTSDLNIYFELGWEIVGSRIDIIKLIKTKQININDTILVTIEDRKFMYDKLYPNVITYEEFEKIVTPEDIIDDWTNKILNFGFLNEELFINNNTNKYVRYEEDFDEIFNGFNLENSNFIKPSSYVVLGIRIRGHNSHKNFSINFFKKIIEKIKTNITKNIYIVGYGSENFCKENDCIYLDRLSDFVYLIKDDKCLAYITQSTGTACLSFVSSNSPIYLIDHTKCTDINGNNAVLGGKCIQFCQNIIKSYYEFSDYVMDDIILNIKNN
jgi:hypothetical protein